MVFQKKLIKLICPRGLNVSFKILLSRKVVRYLTGQSC